MNENRAFLKPSWDDAPEWANWVAMDKDGSWWWHDHKPAIKEGHWVSCSGIQRIDPNLGWEQSLRARNA